MPIKFCTYHRIGYNADLDPVCPQCSIARISPLPKQVDDLTIASETPERPAGRGR